MRACLSQKFDGQISLFNHNGGPNYRDLFPDPPPPGAVPSCAEGGVLGVLPGVIGTLQATEAIKVRARQRRASPRTSRRVMSADRARYLIR